MLIVKKQRRIQAIIRNQQEIHRPFRLNEALLHQQCHQACIKVLRNLITLCRQLIIEEQQKTGNFSRI